ncbi:ATP-binding protein [Kitasatospora sp. NPDC058263]
MTTGDQSNGRHRNILALPGNPIGRRATATARRGEPHMTRGRGTLDDNRSGATLPEAGQRRRLRLAGLPKPVARSRAFTQQALADWAWLAPESGADPDVADDVVLLVAELVANAMMHGGGPLELVLDEWKPGRSGTPTRTRASRMSEAPRSMYYRDRTPPIPGRN